MKQPVLLKLAHLNRGSWLASAQDPRTVALIGDSPIAVLRDWENGLFDWTAAGGPRLSTTTEETLSDEARYWWMRAAHADWRNALHDGALVWVRQAIPDGCEGGSIGRSKGVWRIGNVDINDAHLKLRLVERFGDVKT